MKNKPYRDHLPGAVEVLPLDYQCSQEMVIAWKVVLSRAVLIIAIATIAIFLIAATGFSFLSLPIRFTINPPPNKFEIEGGIFHPKIGDAFLLLPGEYEISAMKSGYEPLSETINIKRDKKNDFNFNLTPNPGYLIIHAMDVNSRTPIMGVKVLINGKAVGETPIERHQLIAASYTIHGEASRYLPFDSHLDIIGKGEDQKLTMEMHPTWAEVSIPINISEANVFVNGKEMGLMPLDFQHGSGKCQITIVKEGFEPWSTKIELKPGEKKILSEINLEPLSGQVSISTDPIGAHIFLNSEFAGLSPIEHKMKPNTIYEIKILKSGFEPTLRTLRVKSGVTKSLNIQLQPTFGIVEFNVHPLDAKVLIEGVEQKLDSPLSLPTINHTVLVRKKGYQSVTRTFIPIKDHPLRLTIILEDEKSLITKFPTEVTLENGYKMKLIVPRDTFFMGSTRREPNRRSNETLREVKLNRPFMIGVHEVSNLLLKQFDSKHRSGEGLGDPKQPVVNISWNEAALFCNWLSEREGFPPVYQKREGSMVALDLNGIGYRLPTEAEWSYCLKSGLVQNDIYPWGKKWPPEEVFANIADQSANNFGFRLVENYNDSYPKTAAGGSFTADRNGLYDMVGNVAEWCHDFYGIYNYNPNEVEVEPIGPNTGIHHVIRGSSWRHGTPTQLRLAFRKYSNDKRDDTGFRLCRYIIPSLH